MTKYLATIIDTLNHDAPVEKVRIPATRRRMNPMKRLDQSGRIGKLNTRQGGSGSGLPSSIFFKHFPGITAFS